MRASNHDHSILQFLIQNKTGLKIAGTMNEYEGIMSGIAQKVYQHYLDKEKKIQDKQSKEREKRKADLDSAGKNF